MYLIIKKSDFGSAGVSYAVAGNDKDRSNAIGKLLALETLNDEKKSCSFQLWSSANGYLGLEETDRKNATYNNSQQEGGQAHE